MKTKAEHDQILATLDANIAAAQGVVEVLKNNRRLAVQQMEEDAPYTCAICDRGVYEPHRHYNPYWRHRRPDPGFWGRMIPREITKAVGSKQPSQ